MPEQRVHERSHAIAERLSLELPRLTDLARVPPDPERRGRFRVAVLDVVLDAWENDDVREAALQLRSTNAALSRAMTALRSALADMTEAIKNAIALFMFCAPIAAVLTWVAWWSGESMLFVLLFLCVLSAIWVVGYLSERTAARKLGHLHDEEGVWRGFMQLFLTLCAMTALGVIGLYAFW
jgi:hypothetical protein